MKRSVVLSFLILLLITSINVIAQEKSGEKEKPASQNRVVEFQMALLKEHRTGSKSRQPDPMELEQPKQITSSP